MPQLKGGYDNAWRLNSLTSPAGQFGYEYPSSTTFHASRITLPNSAWVTNHYDTLSRLDYTALVNKWGNVLDGCGYTHDLLGLRTNIVRDLGLTNSSVSLGYDSIGQLTSWRAREGLSGPLRLNEQLAWVYDAAGNLRHRTNGGLVQTFDCDSLNELTNVSRNSTITVSGATPAPAASVTVNGQPAQTYADFTFAATNLSLVNGANTFSIVAQKPGGGSVTNTLTASLPASVTLLYDSNGNLTNDGTRSFAYSPENQLTNITVVGQWKADFVHDGLGRRRVQRDYSWQSGIGNWQLTNELHMVYDGYLLMQVRDGTNNVLWTLTRGLDLGGGSQGMGGIGGLLALTQSSTNNPQHFFYHADGAGNVTGLLDSQQTMAARYMYSAFGALGGKWGPLADANTMRFSSKPWNPLSDTYDFGFRHYTANLGRWLNPDPLGEAGGINLYQFVYNDPLDWVDADGWQPGAVSVPAMRTGPRQMEFDLPLRQPPPRRWPPGQAPQEEVIRAHEYLLRHGSGATAISGLRPQPGRQMTQQEWTEFLKEHPPRIQAGAPCPPVASGTAVTRQWGGSSGLYGESWSRDPVTRQTRDSLGLGEWNTGEFIASGEIINPAGIITRPARPYGGYRGLGDEVVIPSPVSQVRLNSVVMPDVPIK